MNKKQIRENFRNEVFKRDGNKCRVCGRNDVKLDAHHITNRKNIPSGGYVKENGITLCDTENGCHWKAENVYSDDFLPDNLYKLIKSDFETAYYKSLMLE